MKVSNFTNTVVERTGLADDGEFKIAFNAKMAKILSDSLYSDKITSIIRELSCNAVDSHVESGQAHRPIEVHLPGVFEPWFHVRDFGVGLDHNQVMNIYTTYGASTKTNSNDLVGCLGLGSKSPFSYVDAFDVTAIKDGIMRQYSLYKSEDGMPSVALLLEQPTNEENGVTVKMPVLQTDFGNFKNKAAAVFRWFDIKPTIIGMSDFEIKPVEVQYSGTRWKIRTPMGNYYDQKAVDSPMALMGRVAYPIQASSISGLSSSLNTLAILPLVLEFDIGDLEIAASREALGYDARTQANIKDRLEVVLKELGEQFEQLMKDAKTLWQAHATFNRLFGYNNPFHHSFESIFLNSGLKWNGHVIKSNSITVNTDKIYDPKSAPAITTISGSYRRTRKMEYHRTLYLKCGPNTKIVFDDMERGGASRVNYYHTVNNNNFEIYVFKDTAAIPRNEILDLLGNPEYLLTSNMPKRPSSVVRGERVNMLRYDQTWTKGKRAWVSVDVDDIEDGGIYADLNGWTVMNLNSPVENFNEIVKLAIQTGILDKDIEIYAPRSSFKKKLDTMPEWENIFSVITNGLKAKLTPALLQTVSDLDAFNAAKTEMSYYHWWTAKWNLVDTTGCFAQWVNGMRALQASSSNKQKDIAIADLKRAMGMTVTLPAPSFDGVAAWKAVTAQYPLLTVLMDTYNVGMLPIGNNAVHIRDYINLVDSNKKIASTSRYKR